MEPLAQLRSGVWCECQPSLFPASAWTTGRSPVGARRTSVSSGVPAVRVHDSGSESDVGILRDHRACSERAIRRTRTVVRPTTPRRVTRGRGHADVREAPPPTSDDTIRDGAGEGRVHPDPPQPLGRPPPLCFRVEHSRFSAEQRLTAWRSPETMEMVVRCTSLDTSMDDDEFVTEVLLMLCSIPRP